MRDFIYLTLVPSVCIATAVVTSAALNKKYGDKMKSKLNELKAKLLTNHSSTSKVEQASPVANAKG